MSRLERLFEAVRRNRPGQKPQLWDDLPLAVSRRLAFELRVRLDRGWLQRPHVVALSNVGFADHLGPMTMELVPGEHMNQALFLYGTYEISETRLLQALLRPGMTFADVGANIGYYTLLGSRLVGGAGAVHAFEPNAQLGEKLESNVRRNGLSNVEIHREALAQASGTVQFFASTVASNQGISSILPGDGRQSVGEIPATSLDDFVATLDGRRLDVLKMDIEGAEQQVIAGGSRTLAAESAPLLIFEAHELAPIAAELHRLGFAIRALRYSLARGLELPEVDQPGDNPFADYEAPNYFAAKSIAVFDDVVARAGAQRSSLRRLLGEL
jgi:FkbM family methyltransferase